MKIQFTIESDSDDELEFIEQVARVRDQGLDVGLSESEVARIFIFVAQGLLSESFDSSGVSSSVKQNSVCPSCGGSLEGVEIEGIGEDPVIVPCGCKVAFDNLPDEKIDEIVDR